MEPIKANRSVSWLRVRPRATHDEPRAGHVDIYEDVRYRAVALKTASLKVIYDPSTDEPVEDVTTDINTSDVSASRGLSAENIDKLKEHFGNYNVEVTPTKSYGARVVDMMLSPYHIILIFAAILCITAFGLDMRHFENAGLFGVIVIAVIITIFFVVDPKKRSVSLGEKFLAIRGTNATVTRNGESQVIPANNVLPGDIITLNENDTVPADIRLLKVSRDFFCNQELLSGDNTPVQKKSEVLQVVPPARKCDNIALEGSVVTKGTATGVCVATGHNTVLGRLFFIAGKKNSTVAPIFKDLENLVRTTSTIAVILAIIVFFVGVIRDKDVYIHTIIATAGVLVAGIPESILTTISLTMMLTSSRMRSIGLSVPDVETAETLGMVDTLCCDRTVFTANKLNITGIWTSNVHTTEEFSIEKPSIRSIVDTLTLCSTARWEYENDDTPIEIRDTVGDYIDSTCLRFCEPLYESSNTKTEIVRKENIKLGEVPFLPRNNWTLQIRYSPEVNEIRGYMKGAWERVRKVSDFIMIDGKEEVMTKEHISTIRSHANTEARNGYRIIGLAQMFFPTDKYPPCNDPKDNDARHFINIDSDDAADLFRDDDVRVVFMGLVSIADPPLPGVVEAVEKCRTAGIKVVVTTGEHGWSTESFGREIGLITGVTVEKLAMEKFGWDVVQTWGYEEFTREENNLSIEEQQQITARIIPGHIVEKWNPVNMDENWRRAFQADEIIFSRCSPAQKKMIVEHYRLAGHIVGVTGSDLHDCAAIKSADVGFCCGQNVVEVTREVADVLVPSNNIIPIVNGIQEGRLIFHNLKKSVAYCLTSNMAELVPFLLFAFLRIPLPFTISLALFVDLVTDFVPGLALSKEFPEGDIMRIPAPKSNEGVYSTRLLHWSYYQVGIMEALGAVYTYLVVMNAEGYHPDTLMNRGWDYFTMDSPPFEGYSVEENVNSLRRAQTAFFMAIVLQQIVVLTVVRTRRVSLFHHSMTQNFAANLGIVWSITMAIFIIYTPGVNAFFGTETIPFIYMLPCIPWGVVIFEFDELCKLVISAFGLNGSVQRIMVW